jgi:hypothetical protein
MTHIVFYVDRASVPVKAVPGEISVWLYGPRPPDVHIGTVGSQAFEAASRFGVSPHVATVDFLSIAMAVTAADTFVSRQEAPDRWSRTFQVSLPLVDPDLWNPRKEELEQALQFLSGDVWRFEFVSGGKEPPSTRAIRRRTKKIPLWNVDCVSLFSGGLDSTIGALNLFSDGRKPLLVSHAATGDAQRQNAVAGAMGWQLPRMSVNSYPTWSGVSDDSMRTRSFQFLALGTLAGQLLATASGRSRVELFVCENGFIALNPPLTPRRLGSHSTRTTHPFFLEGIRNILRKIGIPVDILNPYEFSTKGEMVASQSHTSGFESLSAETVSCGKWKRRNQQCGKCLPCLIRRSSLYVGGIQDQTSYEYPDLRAVMNDEDGRDDLVSVQSAIARARSLELKWWVLQGGPLPVSATQRLAYFDVARRGLGDLEAYLRSWGL